MNAASFELRFHRRAITGERRVRLAIVVEGLRGTSSVGWGMFYQVVNIGGFIGPMVTGYLRLLEWRYAFFAAAGIINALHLGLTLLRPRHSGRKTR